VGLVFVICGHGGEQVARVHRDSKVAVGNGSPATHSSEV